MLSFSGGALAAALLFILILTGWNISRSTDRNHDAVREQFFEQMKSAAVSEISAKASVLENDYALILSRLNSALILLEKHNFPISESVFKGDAVFFGNDGEKEFRLLLPKGKSAAQPLSSVPAELQKAVEKSKNGDLGFLVLPKKENGYLWALRIRKKKTSLFAAACRIDLSKQLSELCSVPENCRFVLISGKREIGKREEFRKQNDISQRIPHGMQNLGSRFSIPHSSRIANAEILWNEPEGKHKSSAWIVSAAGLRTPVYSAAPLSLVQAVPSPMIFHAAPVFSFAKLMFLETLIVLAGALIPFLVWIILIRRTSISLKTLLHKANKITRGDLPGIDCNDPTIELNGISGALNHISDKLIGMRLRLQKSHEREMVARKDAEDSSRTKAILLNETISDLAEPLNLISGFSGLLLRSADSDSETGNALRKINDEARSVNRKIQALKDLALLDSSDAEPVYSEFDIYELISSLRSATREAVTEKHIHFEIHSSDISGKIVSDKTILNTILALAADSILLYASPHSRLIIAIRELNSEIEFRISDSPKTDRFSPAKVFSEYRAAPGSAYVPPGYGTALLNLEVLSSKAKLIGASFESSVSQTENSIFTIRFLRNARSVSEAVHDNGMNREYLSLSIHQKKIRKIYLSEGRALSVLVADNSDSAVTMFSMMLEHEHYKTDSASSPDEVLTKLRGQHFDLLLLDLNLQRGLCLDLLRTIRTEISDSIVILTLSSELSSAEKTKLHDTGADHTLLKPIRTDELVDTIRKLTAL